MTGLISAVAGVFTSNRISSYPSMSLMKTPMKAKKFLSKAYIWVKSAVAKFRRPMITHNYHILSAEREQIYKSIQKAFSGEENCIIMDFGLSLFIKLFDREFKIVSHTKDGYTKLLFNVLEYKDTNEIPPQVSFSEIKELSMRNEVTTAGTNFGRAMRKSFIGDSPHPIDIAAIGNEFANKLNEFLGKS